LKGLAQSGEITFVKARAREGERAGRVNRGQSGTGSRRVSERGTWDMGSRPRSSAEDGQKQISALCRVTACRRWARGNENANATVTRRCGDMATRRGQRAVPTRRRLRAGESKLRGMPGPAQPARNAQCETSDLRRANLSLPTRIACLPALCWGAPQASVLA
jgi:hypothetical protein